MGDIAYAWLDMETTGLDANKDVPLEVGIKLTDAVGYEIASESWLIYEDTEFYTRAINRGKRNEFVGPMHTQSGLWDDLDNPDAVAFDRAGADEAMCDFLDEHDVVFGSLGMAGNSIGSLDRPFTLVHFPKLNEFLGHRNIDMSSFKEVMKRTNPDLLENLRPIILDKSAANHRVLDDIDACILEYRAYLAEFLIVDIDV